MTTRAQKLIADALERARAVAACETRHARKRPDLHCWYCRDLRAQAMVSAQDALLATLRKQQLRLAYFAPERERRALLHDLRIALDTNA